MALNNVLNELVGLYDEVFGEDAANARLRDASAFNDEALNQNAKNPAIVVGRPMGAVKEQSSNLYAQKLAERGFVTLSIDLSFWGESEGRPRNVVSPDIYAEDFSAAVDFLGTRPFVDRERIGVLGICGSGSFAITPPRSTRA